MGYSGAGGKLIDEKTRSKKSCNTVPLSILITNNVSTLLENELGCSSQILDTVLFHPATRIRISITGIGVKKKRGSWIHIHNTISNSTKLCRGSVSGSSQKKSASRIGMTSMACRYGSSPSETAFNSMKMKMLINWSFQL